ncbi:MAG: hypothetical protein IT262_00495 [Saprospiraceae bacterium]|nr:hypothetical protein [Saprospiraceae bacterium]
MPLLSQLDEMEVILEQEEVSPEDSGSSGGGFNGGDNDAPVQIPLPSEAFFSLEQANTLLPGRAAAFRQYQVNLLNSFRAPAFFILYHSFQGYLS